MCNTRMCWHTDMRHIEHLLADSHQFGPNLDDLALASTSLRSLTTQYSGRAMDATEDDPPRTPASPTPQRPRSSIPSFLFITFLLFMLTNHSGDEFLARNTYQNALQSLNYQLGNFTAWIGGRESEFVLVRSPRCSSLLVLGVLMVVCVYVAGKTSINGPTLKLTTDRRNTPGPIRSVVLLQHNRFHPRRHHIL
jgi:hypothetical protein